MIRVTSDAFYGVKIKSVSCTVDNQAIFGYSFNMLFNTLDIYYTTRKENNNVSRSVIFTFNSLPRNSLLKDILTSRKDIKIGIEVILTSDYYNSKNPVVSLCGETNESGGLEITDLPEDFEFNVPLEAEIVINNISIPDKNGYVVKKTINTTIFNGTGTDFLERGSLKLLHNSELNQYKVLVCLEARTEPSQYSNNVILNIWGETIDSFYLRINLHEDEICMSTYYFTLKPNITDFLIPLLESNPHIFISITDKELVNNEHYTL